MSQFSHNQVHSLYLHWPFCPYKCHFCPFVALAAHDQFMGRYHRALCKEIESYAETPENVIEDIHTVYIGGGTPSTYPDRELLDMFGTLRNVFRFHSRAEVTIEVNPGTVRPGQCAVWKEAGINRLSIGVQSLKESVLKTLNRHQSTGDVLWLLQEASQLFDSLSIDLILGLPGVSEQEWKEALTQIVSWPINHISIYFLTVHENTLLYFKVKKNQIQLQPDDALVDLYHWTVDLLAQHGIYRYELSNFSRPGYESRHNRVYWERKPFKGFGLGACSFDGHSRSQNEKNLMRYLDMVEGGQDTTMFCESLTREQVFLEQLMLGLRARSGIGVQVLEEASSSMVIKERIELLKEHCFLKEHEGRLLLTPKGLMVENEIIAKLSRN